MAKESKRDVESKSARVAKHAPKRMAKAEVNLNCKPLNWLIEQFIMDCFNCIFISTEDLAYFISIFSLVFNFLLFLAAVPRAWNLMGTSIQNGQ